MSNGIDFGSLFLLVLIIGGILAVISLAESWGENRQQLHGLSKEDKEDLRAGEREFFRRFGTDKKLHTALEAVGCYVETIRTVRTEDGEERQEVSRLTPTVVRRLRDARGVALVCRLPQGMSEKDFREGVEKLGAYADIEGVRDYQVERERPGQMRVYAITRDAFETKLGVDFLD
ncbi:hypothetical protein [Corynebacterium vitaeruminis]|uniref:hypothetical protein n=1 Tax=Corynebacterium vitaeruminis TaxID=38305 RepID=UPI00065F79BE|nr:hypothetical protein [Corynebacterium vitaeruminis]